MENKKNFEQLMIADLQQLTEREKEFKRTHQEVLTQGIMATQNIINMGAALKRMRDGKLYSGIFDTFDDYVENAVGFKARNAYNYIKMYESYPEAFLQSNAKLGVTKLVLLAGLSEKDREDILEDNDVEDVTVSNLRRIIEEKTKRCEQLELEMDKSIEYEEAADKRAQEKVSAVEKEIEKLKVEKNKAAVQVAGLKKQIEELKNAPKETITVPDPEAQAKADALEGQLRAKTAELESVSKQLTIAQDTKMVTFKIKFEELQIKAKECLGIISTLDKDKADKCRLALKSVMEGWKI